MKFESEKVIFKPKRCNMLPIEYRLLDLKSFHKKLRLRFAFLQMSLPKFPPKVFVEFGNVKELLLVYRKIIFCKFF